MTNAINHINIHFDINPHAATHVVVFTDSLSTLQALETGEDEQRYCAFDVGHTQLN